MPLFRYGLTFLFFVSCLCVVSSAQEQSNFPTDDEIKLVLTQTERAVEQYKLLLDQEAALFGETGKEAVAKDREVVRGLEVGIKAFRKNPPAFNGPLGFSFFEWIDDADRNALLCATTSASESITLMMSGKSEKAQSAAQLSQSCLNMSTLFYTVSENVGALYTRYVEGEEKLAKESLQIAEQCTDILKKRGITPKE